MTDTLEPNPNAPEEENGPPEVNGPTKNGVEASPEDENGPADPPPAARRRRTRRKQTEASPPKELTTAQLAALGTLTIEAAKKGLSIDDYAETYLVPLAEAYGAWKAVSGS